MKAAKERIAEEMKVHTSLLMMASDLRFVSLELDRGGKRDGFTSGIRCGSSLRGCKEYPRLMNQLQLPRC